MFLDGEVTAEFIIKEAFINITFLGTDYLSVLDKDFIFKSMNHYHDTIFKFLEVHNKLALSEEIFFNYSGEVVSSSLLKDSYYLRNYLENGRFIYSSYDSHEETILCIFSEIIRYMVFQSYYSEMPMLDKCKELIVQHSKLMSEPEPFLLDLLNMLNVPTDIKVMPFILRNMDVSDLIILKVFFDNIGDYPYTESGRINSGRESLRTNINLIYEERGLADE
jgi:hypothetical protein